MRRTKRRVIFLCITIGLTMILSACGIMGRMDKDYVSTEPMTYLGKYTEEQVSVANNIVSIDYIYFLVFNLLNREGVATPMQVKVTETMYSEITTLTGDLEGVFYKDGNNNFYLLMGDRYFNVKDYDPLTVSRGKTITEYDFINQLYIPQN